MRWLPGKVYAPTRKAMTFRTFRTLVLAIMTTAFLSTEVAFCDLIPANRLIPWNPGVPGGIPNRTNVFANVKNAPYNAKGNDTTDDTAAIQSALNACPSNQVVYLPAATYRINGGLIVPTGVTMRGDGIGQTILDSHSTNGSAIVAIGSSGFGVYTANSNAITSGDVTVGSGNITVSRASGISVGTYLLLNELNDTNIPVSSSGDEGECTWCDSWNGTRSLGQIVEVTSVSGTNFGFSPGAYTTYSHTLSPLATPFAASAKWAGVENLTVFANNTGAGASFYMGNCAYCWFKNVEGNFTDGDHCELHCSFRCEVRHCYFHDAFIHGPGTYDETTMVADGSSACLIEDNIFWRCHTSIMLERGAAGNVVAYNFSTNMYTSGNTNFMPEDMDFCHGSHTMFNLMEGNVCCAINADSIWGSSSWGTLFRNFASGSDYFSNPQDTRYGGPTNAPLPAPAGLLTYPQVQFYAAMGVSITDASRYYNIVGNMIGSAWVKTNTGSVFQQVTPQTLSLYSDIACEFAYGYSETPGARDNVAAYTTAYIEGNWDVLRNIQSWTNMAPTNLPNSYYLSGRPAYFGSCPWPPIDPTNPGKFSPTNIPAAYRFFFGVDPAQPGSNQPPTAVATGVPTSGAAPLAVTFSSAGSSDSDGGTLTYSWTFGDGGTSTMANPNHTYISAGTYATRLQVFDGTNTASSNLTITVTNPPPGVVMTSPTNGASYTAPATISLAGVVATNGHSITAVQFYNGTTMLWSTNIPPYAFTWTNVGVGSYNLTARAVYDGGSMVASASVNVSVLGLVAAYGFGNATNNTVPDASGNGNTGTITSATLTNAGPFGNALSFNGTNSMVTVSNSPYLDLTNGLTLEAWVCPVAIGGWRSLMFKPAATTLGLSYVLQGSSSAGAAPSLGVSVSTSNVLAPSQLPLNTWSHLAGTYDGATMKLYVNGTLVASQAQTGALTISTNALTIGGDLAGEDWSGMIDQVRIYNRAISTVEIQADMNAPVTGGPAPPRNLRVVGP